MPRVVWQSRAAVGSHTCHLRCNLPPDLYKRAAEFYKLKNDLKGASTVLDKAAKYVTALASLAPHTRAHTAVPCRPIARLQAKAADFDGACATMMTAINLFVV